jgi:putative membrane protein
MKPMHPEAHRLHPWSWLFMAARSTKSLVIPALIAIYWSGGGMLSRLELLSLIFIVPAVAFALVRQAVYNYRFSDDELVVRDGLLTRKVRHIPYDRIHNIALVRNPFHRMLGVASARIETAAGGEPEAIMRVLSLTAVEELRHRTLGGRRPAAGDESESTETDRGGAPLLEVPTRELARLGLITNRGLIVVAAVMGLLFQANWWGSDRIWDQDWVGIFKAARDRVPDEAVRLVAFESIFGRVLLVIGVILLFLVILRLFSMAWYVVKYHGFRLLREGADLRTEYGLFTKVSSLIPVHRIQLLTVSASLLHRWLRRASIDLETAGASEEGSELSEQLAASGVKTRRQWLAPIVEARRAVELVGEVMPEIDLDAVDWKPIEARAVGRIVRKVAIIVAFAALGSLATLFSPSISLLGLNGIWLSGLALPVTWLTARKWVLHAGYALTDTAVLFRSGWLSRQVSVVRFDKMQTVTLQETPFDRRNRMASIVVDTAGAGNIGHRIDIPYLDIEAAKSVLSRLYAEGSTTEFRW